MKGGSKGWAWLVANKDHGGDDCLLWPYSVTHKGYGHLGHDGRMWRAHRVMCEFTHGPAPTSKHHAAHNCNNPRCCNPRHIEWKTARENNLDRQKAGTNGTGFGPCRFRPEQIGEIKRLKGQISARDLAPQYGVSMNTIDNIWNGQTYAGPKPRYQRRKLPQSSEVGR